MEAEALLIDYMKKRAEFAKLSASGVLVQCFALAVFFCSYGLSGVYNSDSGNAEVSKIVCIAISIIITALVCIYQVFISFRYKALLMSKPATDILSSNREFLKEAYIISRPVLIYKITIGILIMLLSGPAYIILVIVMSRMSAAPLYGRIIAAILTGIGLNMIIPAFDRIRAYRQMLTEPEEAASAILDKKNSYYLRLIVSIALPPSICIWYIIRYYTFNGDIGWIVFPIAALFGLAIYYLIGFTQLAVRE